ncbi:MAG TPA: hypothetical protein VIU61_05480 [Kofleriaceae bacterium]
MRTKVLLACSIVAAIASVGCKKKGTGGGWLVGADGLMVDVDATGELGDGYDLGSDDTLFGIACRYQAEAWVVGERGTLLYTADGGESWSRHELGTAADLRTLATQDAGPVFVAGDGVFFTGVPDRGTGETAWRALGDGSTRFRSLAAAQRADTVLAVADDGGLWSFESDQLVKRTTIAGARAVAVSPDGAQVIVGGAGLSRSFDGGKTWSVVATDPAHSFADVRIESSGDAVAVGAGGLVARIDREGRVLAQRIGTADLETLHMKPADAANYTGLGFAGGANGQVWLSHDGGWTWAAGPEVGRAVLGADEVGAGHN